MTTGRPIHPILPLSTSGQVTPQQFNQLVKLLTQFMDQTQSNFSNFKTMFVAGMTDDPSTVKPNQVFIWEGHLVVNAADVAFMSAHSVTVSVGTVTVTT